MLWRRQSECTRWLSIANHQPPTRLSIANHQPPTRLSIANHQPPTIDRQPPTTNQVVDRQPPTTNQVVDRQPPTTNQVVDRQPPTTNQVVDRQPITYKLVSVLEDQIASKDKVIEQHQAEIERLRQQLAEQEQMIAALRMKANLYDEQKKLYEEALEQIAELKVKSALYERQEDEIAELKADKADLKRHRDNLTIALSMSKADLARLENVVTQMAALPLSTRIFSWSGTVQHLMEAKSSVDSNMAAEYVVVSEEDQTNNAE